MFKKCLLSLLVFAGFATSFVHSRYQEAPQGKCFCSRICEYRDQKPDDKPITDEESGITFCKIWDKNNYKKRCLAKKR
ncbi:MAG: hypothetical protein ACOYT8_01980 [Candidatus Dependentiae bacterium]